MYTVIVLIGMFLTDTVQKKRIWYPRLCPLLEKIRRAPMVGRWENTNRTGREDRRERKEIREARGGGEKERTGNRKKGCKR